MNERIEFAEFDAAMRMMVQYEWKEVGWKSTLSSNERLTGLSWSLFDKLHHDMQIGLVT